MEPKPDVKFELISKLFEVIKWVMLMGVRAYCEMEMKKKIFSVNTMSALGWNLQVYNSYSLVKGGDYFPDIQNPCI